MVLLIKLIGISIVVAVLIKYGAPTLDIPAITLNALIGVMTPAMVMAVFLLWVPRS